MPCTALFDIKAFSSGSLCEARRSSFCCLQLPSCVSFWCAIEAKPKRNDLSPFKIQSQLINDPLTPEQTNTEFTGQATALSRWASQVHGGCHAVLGGCIIIPVFSVALVIKEDCAGGGVAGVFCCLALPSAAEVQHPLELAVVEEVVEAPDIALLICNSYWSRYCGGRYITFRRV